MSSPRKGGAGTQEMYWYQQHEDPYEEVGNKPDVEHPQKKGKLLLVMKR